MLTSSEAKPTIDRLIDEAAGAGIAILAWTVPRESTAEDVATNARALTYRTPLGHGISGRAVDLERGEEFLGGRVRAAVGPRALLIATVEDPYLEKLDNKLFPYRTIARSADVLQPMTYWRMLRPNTTVERPAAGGTCSEYYGGAPPRCERPVVLHLDWNDRCAMGRDCAHAVVAAPGG